MPELSEIHLYSKLINKECAGQIFRRVSRSGWTKHSFPTIPWSEFTIASKARGKELQLTISPARPVEGANSAPITVTFTHGLVGGWVWTPANEIHNFAHLNFHTNSHVLSFHDVQKMGGWKIGSWGSDRGPDPITEHKAFVANVLDNLSRAPFDKELCEILLEQKYFNGIGNYLRAEVMHRAAVSPFKKARDYFANTPRNFDFSKITPDSDKGLLILYLCRQIPLEVITQDMNKYGTEDQIVRFHKWLRVYDKATQVRKSGRAVHYSNEQLMPGVLKPDLGTPILDMSGATAPVASASPASSVSVSSSSTGGFGASVSSASSSGASFSAAGPISVSAPSSGASAAQVSQILPLVIGNRSTPAVFSAAMAPKPTTTTSTASSFSTGMPAQPLSPQSIISDGSLPATTKLLLLLNQARKAGMLNPEAHSVLKMRVISDDPAIYSALEVFETDSDWEDFVDTIKRLGEFKVAVVAGSMASSVLPAASAAPAAVALPTAGARQGAKSSGMLANLVEPGWIDALKDEFAKPYFTRLEASVEEAYKKNKVHPPMDLIFNAFNRCPLSNVKVVILGQDPYFNPGQAHGLCFSVQRGVPVPPSLKNIYKELESDIQGFRAPNHGCLESWADQGVFLLNAILTVQEGTPMSHGAFGWQEFTSRAIDVINSRCEGVVYMLWGKPAQEKAKNVDSSKNLILKSSHPSPLSAHSGWFGQHQFSQANEYLKKKGKQPVSWQL